MRTASTALISVLLLGVSQAAVAQTANANQIDEIVVTAERKAGSLQDTPIAISAFNQSILEDRQINRTEQLGDYVPNLYMSDGVSNQSTISVTLRGRGEQAGGVATSESPVAFYSDDVYQARLSVTNGEYADVERVEVLRGPQGTLFGRNAMVGAINIISRTPDDDLFIRAAASIGSFEEVKVKAAVGGALIPGSLAASISGVFQDQRKGWKTNIITGEEVDTRKNQGIRGQLHYYGGDTLDVRLIGYYSLANNSGFLPTAVNPVTGEPVSGDLRLVQTAAPSYGRTENWGLTNDAKLSFGDITLRSITGYSEVDDSWRWDITGGIQLTNGSYRAGFDRESMYRQHQFSQELQLSGGDDASFVSWIVGAYYFTESAEQSVRDKVILNRVTGNPVLGAIDYMADTKSYAGFGQVTIRPTEKLDLVAGIRYSRDDKTISGVVSPLFAAPNQIVPVTKASFGSWTPKFTANYRFSEQALVYATVGKGFRAGGFNGFAGNVLATVTSFLPENLWAYEVGAKFDLLDRRVRLNIAAFRNDFTDLQTQTLINGANIVTGNGTDYQVNGLEAELTVTPFAGMQLFGSMGLQDQKFTFIDPASTLFNVVPRPGQTSASPNATASGGFSYETPITGGLLLRFGADFVYRSSSFANVENRPLTRNSSVQRLNGFIGIATQDDRWTLNLQGRNITDADDWVNGFDLVGFLGAASRQALDPRTITLELRFAY